MRYNHTPIYSSSSRVNSHINTHSLLISLSDATNIHEWIHTYTYIAMYLYLFLSHLPKHKIIPSYLLSVPFLSISLHTYISLLINSHWLRNVFLIHLSRYYQSIHYFSINQQSISPFLHLSIYVSIIFLSINNPSIYLSLPTSLYLCMYVWPHLIILPSSLHRQGLTFCLLNLSLSLSLLLEPKTDKTEILETFCTKLKRAKIFESPNKYWKQSITYL